jgi:Ca2+/H+ antiporter
VLRNQRNSGCCAIRVATLVAAFFTSGGRSAWFVGVLLLLVYAVFALTLNLWPPPLQ